jgi:hypothetical protein
MKPPIWIGGRERRWPMEHLAGRGSARGFQADRIFRFVGCLRAPDRSGEPQSARDEQCRDGQEQKFFVHWFFVFEADFTFIFAACIVRESLGVGF